MGQNKKKTIIILSVLLIFQVILILFLNIFSNQSVKTRSIDKKLFKGLKKEDVTFLEISDINDTFTIQKEENLWFVNTKGNKIPGNDRKIEDYIDNTIKLTSGVIRDKGNNPEADKQYGFDNERRQKVVIKTKSKKEYTIFIGSTGFQKGTSYIKINREKKIREVVSNIASETSNQASLWAKRNLFDNLDRDEVEKCEIKSNMDWFNGSYSILYKESNDEKNKGKFVIEPPVKGQLKDYTLGNIIYSIVSLNIDNYKFNVSVTNREKKAEITLTLKNAKTFKLTFYKADENDRGNYIIDVDFNNYLYLIDEEDVKRFIKSEEDLLKE